jgi:hypothetical protein
MRSGLLPPWEWEKAQLLFADRSSASPPLFSIPKKEHSIPQKRTLPILWLRQEKGLLEKNYRTKK